MSFLGDRLRQIREARGISPLQVEIDTRIRANVILALEAGDYESLPPEPFLRGLIRSYSTYLGADPQEMLDLHVADLAPATPPPTRQPIIPRKSPPPPKPQSTEAPAPSAKRAPASSPASLAPVKPAGPPPPVFDPSQSAGPVETPSAPAKTAPPPPPPEMLAPPEKFSRPTPTDEGNVETPFQAHLTRRGLPLPVLALVGVAVIMFCLASTLVVITRIGPAALSLIAGRTPTPSRPVSTATPTLQLGAAPTNIPALAVTAAPFATFPGNPQAASSVPTLRTSNFDGLVLDVAVTQTIKLQVGIDNVLVFNGQMEPDTTRSWMAKNVLYVRVENPRGATLALDGNTKWFNPRNYAERDVMERQWSLDDKGAPVSVAPIPPAPSTPAPTLTSVFRFGPAPTSTQ